MLRRIANSVLSAAWSLPVVAAIALATMLLAPVDAAAPASAAIKAPGDKQPEAFLPAEAVIYCRFDGLELHRKAYEQTALAEVMKGDLGKFLDYGIKVLKENVFGREDGPLSGMPVDLREKVVKSIPDAFEYFKNRGFAAAVEVIDVQQPRAQLTAVFPGGGEGKNKDAITGVVQLICALARVEIKEEKALDRTIYSIPGLDPVKIAWWQEGGHLILTVGTESPEHTLKLIADRDARPNVTRNPLYQQVTAFQKYPTSCRGFVDVDACLKLARGAGKDAEKFISDLGVDGIKNITFHMGFEGKACRTSVAVKTAKERRGLLKVFSGQKGIGLKDLPPIPADATTVSAMELNLGTLYDSIILAIETVAGAIDKDALAEFHKGLKEMNQVLGVDLRKDLLASFGDRIVCFDSPSEGAMMTGTTLCVQVKDARKLHETLEKMCKAISEATGVQVTIKKRDYHGVELCTIHVNMGRHGIPVVPSFAIHKDWCIMGLYPQPVQGTLLRAAGKTPTWKPSPLLEKLLSEAAKDPKVKVISFSEDDPRPSIKFLLSFGTLAGGLIETFAPGVFDPAMLPNAHAVCEPLFPNVAIVLDDGETIRYEAHTSLTLPFNASGVMVYAAAMGFQYYMFRSPPFGGPAMPPKVIPPIEPNPVPDPAPAP